MLVVKEPGPSTFVMSHLDLRYPDYYKKLDACVPTLLTAVRASSSRQKFDEVLQYHYFIIMSCFVFTICFRSLQEKDLVGQGGMRILT